MTQRNCKGINKSGEPCGMFAFKGEEFCFKHSQSDRGIRIRQQANHRRSEVVKLTPHGRILMLEREYKRVRLDKMISTSDRVRTILRIFNEIDRLEVVLLNKQREERASLL